MRIEILADADQVARRAAEFIAAEAHGDADRSIPAGRVRQDQALILADRAAAGSLGAN